MQTVTEGIGAVLRSLTGTENVVDDACGLFQDFVQYIIQNVTGIIIMQIKGAPVDVRQLTDFSNGDFRKLLFVQKLQKSIFDNLAGVAGPPVLPWCLSWQSVTGIRSMAS